MLKPLTPEQIEWLASNPDPRSPDAVPWPELRTAIEGGATTSRILADALNATHAELAHFYEQPLTPERLEYNRWMDETYGTTTTFCRDAMRQAFIAGARIANGLVDMTGMLSKKLGERSWEIQRFAKGEKNYIHGENHLTPTTAQKLFKYKRLGKLFRCKIGTGRYFYDTTVQGAVLSAMLGEQKPELMTRK